MSATLDRIVDAVREELEKRKSGAPFSRVAEAAARNGRRRELHARRADGPGIIAEIKRASPSRGWIRRDLDAVETARSYVRGGACAVSVLTQERYFGGSLADLAAVSGATGDVPVLRKDFVLDEYMLAESRAFGADLVLLMVSLLGSETARMVSLAATYGLLALVEVHDEGEMALAADSGATLIGINNRNLKTLEVDLATSEKLLPHAPGQSVKVVESGISSAEDVRRFHVLGADAFLVGESLVTSGNAEGAIRTLRGK